MQRFFGDNIWRLDVPPFIDSSIFYISLLIILLQVWSVAVVSTLSIHLKYAFHLIFFFWFCSPTRSHNTNICQLRPHQTESKSQSVRHPMYGLWIRSPAPKSDLPSLFFFLDLISDYTEETSMFAFWMILEWIFDDTYANDSWMDLV
jgi:hypothetical protein